MKEAPLRRCVGCGESKEKKALIRVVRTAAEDGTVVFAVDRTGKLNGRGAYLCDNLDCFNKAYKKKGFDRSFHASIPAEVYETLQKEFDERGEA